MAVTYSDKFAPRGTVAIRTGHVGGILVWSNLARRFHYGPLEWVWRSLSRLQLQPLLKN